VLLDILAPSALAILGTDTESPPLTHTDWQMLMELVSDFAVKMQVPVWRTLPFSQWPVGVGRGNDDDARRHILSSPLALDLCSRGDDDSRWVSSVGLTHHSFWELVSVVEPAYVNAGGHRGPGGRPFVVPPWFAIGLALRILRDRTMLLGSTMVDMCRLPMTTLFTCFARALHAIVASLGTHPWARVALPSRRVRAAWGAMVEKWSIGLFAAHGIHVDRSPFSTGWERKRDDEALRGDRVVARSLSSTGFARRLRARSSCATPVSSRRTGTTP